MPKPDIAEEARTVLAYSKEGLLKFGTVPPTVFVVAPDGKMLIFNMTPFFSSGDHGKDVCAGFMRRAALGGAQAVMLVSEIWVVRDGAVDAKYKGSLEHVPGRAEAIMITVSSPQRDYHIQQFFERDAEGKPVFVGEPEFVFESTGRFLHLYPARAEA